jgi:Peptidase family M48
MGFDSYQQILSKPADSEQVEGLDRSPAHEQVTRVARRIAAATERNDYQWEFKVLDDPQVNAFCLPGGNVAVYPGLFPMARDDVGLAAVLGQRSRTRSRDTAASACRSSSPLRDSRPPPRRRFSPGTIRA